MDQMQTGGRSTGSLRRTLGKQGMDSGRSSCTCLYSRERPVHALEKGRNLNVNGGSPLGRKEQCKLI